MNSFVKLLLPLVLLGLPIDARADVAGATAAALSAETVAGRNTALAELAAAKASDPLAAYAAGSVQFFVALEKLASGLHRHVAGQRAQLALVTGPDREVTGLVPMEDLLEEIMGDFYDETDRIR